MVNGFFSLDSPLPSAKRQSRSARFQVEDNLRISLGACQHQSWSVTFSTGGRTLIQTE